MAEFRYEMSVDRHKDNMYTVFKDGIVFGKIFLLDEGFESKKRKTSWTGWCVESKEMLSKDKSWLSVYKGMQA